MHKMTGRYQAFGSTQTGTEGYSVHKMGVGKVVTIHYSGAYRNGSSVDVPREKRQERMRAAIDLLRSIGYSVDDRGWIECESYDECDW
jgi:hypothetical protein